MPTRKNNKIKEFAIGTKIEYNGKLYEVVEQNFCDECSLKNICPNTDVVTNNNSDNLLSRDKRLSIFGECSSLCRKDRKCVVFKEISSDDVYDVGFLYKNDKREILPIIINIPSGYVIDEERSDLAKGIIEFKSKWLSIEDIYRLLKENNYSTYRSSIISFHDGKLIALANLMDIALYFNKGWNYNVMNKDSKGYAIYYNNIQLDTEYYYNLVNLQTSVYYGTPIFKNREDAQYVIDNPYFRAILDKIFKV